MSKVLKVIADILIIVFILAAAAIFVPPLFSITTAVATPEVTTNMDRGTVAYGQRVKLEELASGDTLIYSGDEYALLCEVEAVDPETDIVTVKVDGTTQQIQYHNAASRLMFTIPFIGYMSIALQSFEGRIILILVAALIVVLLIVAEVWSNKEREDRDYEMSEEEDDDEYFRALSRSSARGTPRERDAFAAADAGIAGRRAEPEDPILRQDTAEIKPIFTMKRDLADTQDIAERVGKHYTEDNDADEASGAFEVPEGEGSDEELQDIDFFAAEIIEEETSASAQPAAGALREENREEEPVYTKPEEPREEEPAYIEPEKAREEEPAYTKPEKTPREEEEARKAPGQDAIPEEKEKTASEQYDRPRKPAAYEGEDFSDLNDQQMEQMESALETALAKTEESDKTDHYKTAAAPEQAAAPAGVSAETPDEIELAVPVHTLEEILQEAYSSGEDPHVKKDSVTGITLVDFSESFK